MQARAILRGGTPQVAGSPPVPGVSAQLLLQMAETMAGRITTKLGRVQSFEALLLWVSLLHAWAQAIECINIVPLTCLCLCFRSEDRHPDKKDKTDSANSCPDSQSHQSMLAPTLYCALLLQHVQASSPPAHHGCRAVQISCGLVLC